MKYNTSTNMARNIIIVELCDILFRLGVDRLTAATVIEGIHVSFSGTHKSLDDLAGTHHWLEFTLSYEGIYSKSDREILWRIPGSSTTEIRETTYWNDNIVMPARRIFDSLMDFDAIKTHDVLRSQQPTEGASNE